MTFPPVVYPGARRDPTVDEYHGTRVEDPYRWLEDPHSPDTAAWAGAQNALTRSLLDGPRRQALRDELERLYDYPRATAPVPRGSRYFFMLNAGLQNQPVLYVHDAGVGTRPSIDPNAFSADGTVAMTAWEASEDGRFVAYAVSRGGSDWQEVRIRDVDAGRDLDDRLDWAKFVTISWAADGRGFYYTRFPPHSAYCPAVYWHRLGDSADADRLVHAASDDPEVVYEVDQSSDHRVLVITAFKGASENTRVLILPLAEGTGLPAGGLTLGDFTDAWHFIDADGEACLFRTNHGAPRGRVVRVDSTGAMREIVAESADSLIDARIVSRRIVTLSLHNASSRVQLFDMNGGTVGEVMLPTIGSVTEMTGERGGHELFLRFASYVVRPTILRVADLSTSREHALPADPWPPAAAGDAGTPSDAGPYAISQEWYPSRDGTRISMFLVHRRDVPRDGNRPVWLTGYGGFNVNMVPDYDPAHFVWLARGGVLAVPQLRGGGEYGEAWHEAGRLERKQNVFDDAIAAAEHLIATGLTRPGRLVFEGGSNGGLLVAAVLTQRPDLPGAVICRVPVADMLRYHLFTVGRFWIPEYGCSEDPLQFPFLHAYSPLHRVRNDLRYPPVLITTAETDDRVDPGMARKLAARLQEACAAAGGGPVFIRIERRAGHGAGKPVAKLIEEDCDIYTFALTAMGLSDER